VGFGADGTTYIVDWNNHAIRQVTAQGTLTTVAGALIVGDGPVPSATASDLVFPGAPGSEIALNHPTDIKALPDGKMLVVCWHNHKLRTYDPATNLLMVSCGREPGFAGDGGAAFTALVDQPSKAAIAPNGDIFLLDMRNQRVRKIDAAGNISTVAGTGVAGFSGDGGPPLSAAFHFPRGPNPAPGGGIALDTQGRLYIADSLNHRIRRIDLGANTVETIAGDGTEGYGGDGGQASAARINFPFDLDFGPDGRLYFADCHNHRIRAIDLGTGVIETVAGNGTKGFSGDGGPAVEAALSLPSGVAFDAQGRLYIADTENSRIRRVIL
jgi:hypothetical protein